MAWRSCNANMPTTYCFNLYPQTWLLPICNRWKRGLIDNWLCRVKKERPGPKLCSLSSLHSRRMPYWSQRSDIWLLAEQKLVVQFVRTSALMQVMPSVYFFFRVVSAFSPAALRSARSVSLQQQRSCAIDNGMVSGSPTTHEVIGKS